jgi:hypothetical protein
MGKVGRPVRGSHYDLWFNEWRQIRLAFIGVKGFHCGHREHSRVFNSGVRECFFRECFDVQFAGTGTFVRARNFKIRLCRSICSKNEKWQNRGDFFFGKGKVCSRRSSRKLKHTRDVLCARMLTTCAGQVRTSCGASWTALSCMALSWMSLARDWSKAK